jgi:hypothetical protein
MLILESPVETDSSAHGGPEISSSGMLMIIALFIFFPALLFVVHVIFAGL